MSKLGDMTRFDWHARNHQDALDGMLALSLEERGAYNTVLDLIYSRAGPIPDEDRWLAGWMGCSVKKWKLLRAALVVKGKLYALNFNGTDSLMSETAQAVFAKAGLRPSQSEWAALRAEVFRRDGERCAYCGDVDGPFECDHVIPVSQRGWNVLSNLVVACRSCNRSKRDRTPDQWRAALQ